MPFARQRAYRWFLPIWLWAFLAVVAALVGWVRSTAATYDPGIANVNTMLLTILALLVSGVWFVFLSRFPRRIRLGVLGAGIASLVAFLLLFRFESFSGNMVPRFARRAVAAPAPPAPAAAGVPVDLARTTPDDFPGFLGPGRDLTVRGIRLARDWKMRPPRLVWKHPIGPGWSAFAIVNGVAVTMEERDGRQQVSAYGLATGELLWAHSWPGKFFHVLGGAGPRSTPLIDDGRVYALGPAGRFVCLDGSTGELLWEKDLVEEFGSSREQDLASVAFGRSNSPLVVGDLVIIPAGGSRDRPPASLVAYDKRTGERRWEGGRRQISYSSPRWARLAGVEQILILNEDTASGHDPASGRTLWEHPWPGISSSEATASQAVPLPPDRVLLSKGYGQGAALLELVPGDAGGFETRELWHNRRVLRTKFTNVAVLEGHAYGLSQGILECVRLDTGERVWKAGRYGHGQILLVGETLLVLGEDGEVTLVEATPEHADRVLGRFQALDGPSWANPALSSPYLALRNAQEAAVYELPLSD